MDNEATCGKCATINYSYYGLLKVRNREQGHQVNKVARKFCGQNFSSLPTHPKKDAQFLDFTVSNSTRYADIYEIYTTLRNCCRP
jgi:hypothetical protein